MRWRRCQAIPGSTAGRAGTLAQPEAGLVGRKATPAGPPCSLPHGMGCVLGQGWLPLANSMEARAGEPLGKDARGRQAGGGLGIPPGTRSPPSPLLPVLLLLAALPSPPRTPCSLPALQMLLQSHQD